MSFKLLNFDDLHYFSWLRFPQNQVLTFLSISSTSLARQVCTQYPNQTQCGIKPHSDIWCHCHNPALPSPIQPVRGIPLARRWDMETEKSTHLTRWVAQYRRSSHPLLMEVHKDCLLTTYHGTNSKLTINRRSDRGPQSLTLRSCHSVLLLLLTSA